MKDRLSLGLSLSLSLSLGLSLSVESRRGEVSERRTS